MNWIELIRDRLRQAYARLPFSDHVKEKVVEDELEACVKATEAGRGFGESPAESEPEDEKLTELRRIARAEWEPWAR
jgi:hypothetical protein